MKRKVLALVVVFALIAVAVVGTTLAYLTDSDKAVNVFTVGDVDIRFDEEAGVYDDGDTSFTTPLSGKIFPDDGNGNFYRNIQPTNVIRKDATVSNIGNTDAYVRVIVIMNNKEAINYSLTKASVDEVFTGWGATYADGFNAAAKVTAGVDLIKTDLDDANGIIGSDETAWVYYYKLTPGAVADVFDGLKAPAEKFDKKELAMFDGLKIEILVDAIQTEGFASSDEAFTALEAAHPMSDQHSAAGGPSYTVTTAEELADTLAVGGNVTLGSDITVNEVIEIPEGTAATLNLNGKTITGTFHKSIGAVIKNSGTLTITGGTIKSTADNGGSAVQNLGTLTVNDATLNGAPNADDSWPSYTVNNDGVMTLNNTMITSYHGAVASYGEGAELTLNNCEIDMAGIPGFTNHAIYTYNNGKVVINGGTYANNAADQNSTGGSCINGAVTVNSGTFTGRIENYYGTPVIKGGTFSVNPTRFVASGYKAVANGDGTYTVTYADLSTAIGSGASDITLSAGDYVMPSVNGDKEINISGTKDTVIDITNGAYMDSATVSFEGVTIKGSTGYANGNGSDYAALYTPNVTYTDCTFDGPFRIGRDGAKFINCKFTNLGNDYVWTYGNDATFIGCTFESDGKALLIYSDGGNEVSKVTVTGCTFNATQGAKAGAIANQNCAAIEIDNYGNGVNLTTSGNTINTVNDTLFSGEWRIKSYDPNKTDVIVNGTEYTSLALDGKTMTIDASKNVTVNP